MLIRSQDKGTIFDMTGSTIIIKRDNSVAGFGNNQGMDEPPIDLGYYGTEDRAIEVLDEICIAYISLNDKDRKTGFAYVKNGIYQMPEE